MQVDYLPELVGVTVCSVNEQGQLQKFSAEFNAAMAKINASLDLQDSERLLVKIEKNQKPIYPGEEILTVNIKDENAGTLRKLYEFRVCEQDGIYGLYPRYELFFVGDEWLSLTNTYTLRVTAERYVNLITSFYKDGSRIAGQIPSGITSNIKNLIRPHLIDKDDEFRLSSKLVQEQEKLLEQFAKIILARVRPYRPEDPKSIDIVKMMLESRNGYLQAKQANSSNQIDGPNEEIDLSLRMFFLAARILMLDYLVHEYDKNHSIQDKLTQEKKELSQELNQLADYMMNKAVFQSQDAAGKIKPLSEEIKQDLVARLKEIHGEIPKICSTLKPTQDKRKEAAAFLTQGARVTKMERCRQCMLEAESAVLDALGARAFIYESAIKNHSAKARCYLGTTSENELQSTEAFENYQSAKFEIHRMQELANGRQILGRSESEILRIYQEGVQSLVETKRRSETLVGRIKGEIFEYGASCELLAK